MKTVNIDNLKIGNLVKYSYPKNGYNIDQENAKKYLEFNSIYQIEDYYIDNWVTFIKLVGYEYWFNSVLFEDVNTPLIISDFESFYESNRADIPETAPEELAGICTLDLIREQHECSDIEQIIKKFIEKHKISCPEAISQNDKIIENAYDFIQELCDIVGYYKNNEDENNE